MTSLVEEEEVPLEPPPVRKVCCQENVGVVDQAVADGVGDGGVRKGLVPSFGGGCEVMTVELRS